MVLFQEQIGQRSETLTMTAEEFGKLNEHAKSAVINVEDVPVEPFEAPPAPTNDVETSVKRQKEWEVAKAEYDRRMESQPKMKKVNLWMPIRITHKVTLDGREVKIYHTLRGPMMGVVINETTEQGFLYSPCLIDPNIERGRVHYLPVAFAGFHFSVNRRSGMGESVPQEAEVLGYPQFIENNRKGDYRFRMRAAYHHIDADYPEDSMVASADIGTRDASLGLIPTSDTREMQLIGRTRQMQALEAAQAAVATPVATPESVPPPSEKPV